MKKSHISKHLLISLRAILFSFIAALMFITSATAATANDSPGKFIQDNALQMTSSSRWTYDKSSFEQGISSDGLVSASTTLDIKSISPVTWLLLSGLLCLLSIVRLFRE